MNSIQTIGILIILCVYGTMGLCRPKLMFGTPMRLIMSVATLALTLFIATAPPPPFLTAFLAQSIR